MAGASEGTDRQGSGYHAPTATDILLDPQEARLEQIFGAASQVLHDPFSDATRERQKYLLVVALLTMCLARSVISIENWKPEDLEVRINLTSHGLSYIFAGATLYLMILFGIGAWQELTTAGYELRAAMPRFRKLFLDAALAPGKLQARKDKVDPKWAAFKDEWEAARAADELAQKSLAPERQKLEDRRRQIEHEHSEKWRQLKAMNAGQAAREAETRRYDEAKFELNEDEQELFDRSRASIKVREDQQAHLIEKHKVDEQGKEFVEIALGSVKAYLDPSAPSALKVVKTIDRHLKSRRWLELFLPLIFGAIAVYMGLHPVASK
jgi:flagellar biosynthesis GTPase FlhF